jgi:uncharacterized protein (TIGR03000 family)
MRCILLIALGALLAVPTHGLAQSNSQGARGRRDDNRHNRREHFRRYPVQPWWWYRWGWYPTPLSPYYYAAPPGGVYDQTLPSPAAAAIESIRALAGPNRASLEIIVPEATADVQIEGQRTTLYGTKRYFVSPYLEPAKTFQYTVIMKRYDSGKLVEEVRRVEVRGGSWVTIDFTRPQVETLPPR